MLLCLALSLTPVQFDTFTAIEGLVGTPIGTTGDLDGDGLHDGICWELDSGYVYWSRSRGGVGQGLDAQGEPARLQRLFESPLAPALSGESRLLAADLDGDGDTDLALLGSPRSNSRRTELLVAWNDGSAVMTVERSPGSLDGRPVSLAAVDLDRDGDLEIAVCNENPSSGLPVTVVFDHQGGSISPAVPLLEGPPVSTAALRVGDLSGDGEDELVLRAVMRGGAFYPLATVSPGQGLPLTLSSLNLDPGVGTGTVFLDAVEVGDLDGDGDDDVFTLPQGPVVKIDTWLQTAPGTYTLGASPALRPGSQYSKFWLGDQDGDGDLDMVTRASSPQLFYDLHINSGGTFAAAIPEIIASGGIGSLDLVDMTGDGRADVFVTNPFFPSTISFRPSEPGTGLFGELARVGDDIALAPLVTIDANGDLYPDLIHNNFGEGVDAVGSIGLRLGLAGGGFGPTTALTGPGAPSRRPVVGDFDGDGQDDVLVAGPDYTTFELLRGLGGGGFGQPSTVLSISRVPRYVVAEDLDADGRDDLMYAFSTPGGLTRVAVAFGSVAGPLEDPSEIPGDFPTRVTPAAGDYDLDGHLDLAMLVGDRVEVSMQDAGRSFGAPTTAHGVPAAASNEAVLAGDLDLDGRVDLLIPGRVHLRGLGDGTFEPPVPVVGLTGGSQVLVDTDLDGDLDLVLEDSLALYVAENVGGLSFAPPQQQHLNGRILANHFTVSDLDRDGDPDLLVSSLRGAAWVIDNSTLTEVGASYCGAAAPNSTGAPGVTRAFGPGSPGTPMDELDLISTGLPMGAPGFYLCSRTQDDVLVVPNSVGRLCLGGNIGRFIGPGQVLDAGPRGEFALTVDTSVLPTPNLGPVPAMAGETWSFQGWHRDSTAGGGATSNFTSAVSVTF